MVERLSFDTSFLIDIQKEMNMGRKGRAHNFLSQHSAAMMLVSAVALGEFAEGFNAANSAQLEKMLDTLEILDIDRETALLYGMHARRLRQAGQLIGGNDLWIGCSALRHNIPLVTGNGEHFRRIRSLAVIEY